MYVRGEKLHPANAIFDLPVEPTALAIGAVGSKGDIHIRGEPGTGPASRPGPLYGEVHQLPADANSFEFRKHRNDPELARGTIS